MEPQRSAVMSFFIFSEHSKQFTAVALIAQMADTNVLQQWIYLHGEALPTAGVSTAERPLALMVSQYVTLQVEATSEFLVAAFFGARQHPLLPRVGTQLVLVQEPGVVKLLFALSTWHLDWEALKNTFVTQLMSNKVCNATKVMFNTSQYCIQTFVFSSVLQIFCPRLSLERTTFSLTGVTCSRETDFSDKVKFIKWGGGGKKRQTWL